MKAAKYKVEPDIVLIIYKPANAKMAEPNNTPTVLILAIMDLKTF